ncbi:MAG: hypothetical protein ACR2OE_01250 [Thermomicrobiales bacterium]
MIDVRQEILSIRLLNFKNERRILVRDYGMLKDSEHPFPTADNKAAFRNVDDLSYYERLTGHIEEIQYLSNLLK